MALPETSTAPVSAADDRVDAQVSTADAPAVDDPVVTLVVDVPEVIPEVDVRAAAIMVVADDPAAADVART
jgi:hypothetical protein